MLFEYDIFKQGSDSIYLFLLFYLLFYSPFQEKIYFKIWVGNLNFNNRFQQNIILDIDVISNTKNDHNHG